MAQLNVQLNYKFQKHDHRDIRYETDHLTIDTNSSVSLRDKMPPILDQGNIGSCVSNTMALCLHYCMDREANKPYPR
jgi:hypothetical protein